MQAGRIMRALAGALAMLLAPQALAQTYPNRPIRLIVPYPPGGGTDFFARLVAGKMGEALGQPMVVENRPGASTMIGAEAVAKSAPDGYTLLVGDNATYALNPFLYSKLPYDPLRDLEPVTRTMVAALAVTVPDGSPIRTTADFVAAIRAKGGQFNYGSPGPGSPHHLAMELFLQAQGLKATHVPYKGASPALQDLLTGRLDGMFLDLGTGGPHFRSGKLRALAVSTTQRIGALPGVSTVAETVVPGYEAVAWQGFAFPTGTPKEAVARIGAEYAKAVADPQVRTKMLEVGFEPTPSTPEQFAALIRSEQAKWEKVVREGKIKLD